MHVKNVISMRFTHGMLQQENVQNVVRYVLIIGATRHVKNQKHVQYVV